MWDNWNVCDLICWIFRGNESWNSLIQTEILGLFSDENNNVLTVRILFIYVHCDAFPGNGSVNTFQHATVEKAVFSMWSAPHTVWELCFLYVVHAEGYNRHGKSFGAVEFRSSKGTVLSPEVVEGIRLYQEDLVCDFTCAVVQWYWECVI
jgi:hypothetical protein